MEKLIELGELLDWYGLLLTEKQREIMAQYANENCSLSEIAKKLTASVFAFIESVLSNVQLGNNQKLSLFLITNSDSVIQMFEDFHKRITLTSSDSNYGITAIYIFKDRPMVKVSLL